jgi:hypothetical protein
MRRKTSILLSRTPKQNDHFFGNGVSRVGIQLQLAVRMLNGRTRAHVVGLMSTKSDRRGLISPMPTRAHVAAYNKRLKLPPRSAAS